MNEEKAVELADELIIVKVIYKGASTSHHLRPPTNEESLAYRRRTSKYTFKRGIAQVTDEAMMAPYWLYDKLCERVEGCSYKGQPLMTVEGWKEKVPLMIKEAVVSAFLARVEPGEEEEGN